LRKVDDYINSDEVKEFVKRPEVKSYIVSLNLLDKVMYPAVLNIKRQILSMMYNHFVNNGSFERKNAFEDYKKAIELVKYGKQE
jgi:4-alpha-glucanotransferase